MLVFSCYSLNIPLIIGEVGMKKCLAAIILLWVLVLQTKALAYSLNCKFKDPAFSIEGVASLQLYDSHLIINEIMEIPLEKSRVKCGSFGRQQKLQGHRAGLQIILRSCTDAAILEGHLIDAHKSQVAEVVCN
jgi:hypothetical protein